MGTPFSRLKESYYKEYFQENKNKNNLIKDRQGINNIILIKTCNKVQPTFLKINDSLTVNNKKVAEEFNSFFGTIAQKIDQKTPKFNKHFSNSLKNKNLFFLLLQPVTEKKLWDILVVEKL